MLLRGEPSKILLPFLQRARLSSRCSLKVHAEPQRPYHRASDASGHVLGSRARSSTFWLFAAISDACLPRDLSLLIARSMATRSGRGKVSQKIGRVSDRWAELAGFGNRET
jgi:hypothetical protein